MKIEKFKKVISVAKQLASFIPQPLPQSEAAVAQFAEEVLTLGNLPSNDSFLRAICSALMHLSQSSSFVSKRSVLQGLRRSILNQCAYNLISDIKKREVQVDAKAVQTTTG